MAHEFTENQMNVCYSTSKYVGKNFGELGDIKKFKINSKGGLGQHTEFYMFGNKPNSSRSPDLPDIGIEVKVTPIRIIRNKDGEIIRISAKERLVSDIIDYEKEYNCKTIYDSSFFNKCRNIFFVFYEYKENVLAENLRIEATYLYSVENDPNFPQINEDWQTIHNTVLMGKAETLSEKNTKYLGACTKGENKYSVRKQLNSNVMAKQRAYCLKSSYMSILLMDRVFNKNYNSECITRAFCI